MTPRILAPRACLPLDGDSMSPPDASSHVMHIQGVHSSEAGWELAAPERVGQEIARPEHATHSATAADFFDVVFVTVALVAYTADALQGDVSVRTEAVRSARSHSTFQIRQASGIAAWCESPSGHQVRFRRVAAETAVLCEPLRLSPPTARAPRALNLSTGHCPTGPPQLPHISVRGWTSRYA